MRIISNLPNPTAPSTERPDGALKDVTAPAAGDGTPARADWLNDLYYALLAVMDTVGVSADDSDEEFEAGTGASQFLDAMRLFAQEWAYPGQDQGLKNISAGNQTTDITAFEAGGGSEKEDGFTVRVRWTAGDASFNHQLTSAYTVGNEISGFKTATLWKGEGAGELVLRLDKTNSKWLVLTPGIWDTGSNSDGNWQKYVNGFMDTWEEVDKNNASTAAQTFSHPVAFSAAPNLLGTQQNNSNTGTMALAASIPTTTQFTVIIFGTSGTGASASTRTADIAHRGPW